MFDFVFKLLIAAFGVLLAEYLVPGVTVDSFATALIAAAVLGVFNLIVKPVLVILTFPLTILTLGFFTFIINALLFWFIAYFIPGFAVESFFAAFFGAFIVSFVSFVGERLVIPAD